MHSASVVVAHPAREIRDRVSDALRSRDIQVYSVPDVAGAVAAAGQSRPCALLIDPDLLQKEPADLRVNIRQSAGYHIPIIALTHVAPGPLKAALQRHGAHLLPRPIDDLVPLADTLQGVAERLATAPFFQDAKLRAAPANRTTPKATAQSILVVDDERAIREFVTEALRDEGFQVQSAPSPEDALDFLAKNDVDLVISDINMPGMDGFALKLQIDLWQKKPVPFIAITADASEENISNAEAVGAVTLIAKPIRDLDAFYGIVRAALTPAAPQA